MPELPEVETVRRTLRPVLLGRRFEKVEVRLPKLIRGSPLEIVKLNHDRICGLERRAKILIIRLESGRSLLIHLKMTGQLIHVQRDGKLLTGGHPIPGGEVGLPNRTTQAIFHLDDGSALFFNDVRKFAYLRLHHHRELQALFTLLGPEPLLPSFTFAVFRSAVARRLKSQTKDVLLDQSVIAGLGNIYADEVNFAARIHPRRLVRSLSEEELRAIYGAIKRILRFAVQKRGTTFRHFRDGRGAQGGMRAYLKVYGRSGQPCVRCKTLIVREKLGSRSAHYCPRCQTLTKPKWAGTLSV